MTDLLAIAERVARHLEADGFDCVLGGAVALAAYTPPRATLDLDFGVRAAPEQLPDLLASLGRAGCSVPEGALDRAQRGDFGVRFEGVRIDLFPSSTELAEAALDRRVDQVLGGHRLSLATPEDLVLLKLLFHRTKDRADLERLFSLCGRSLDYAYLDDAVERNFSDPNDGGRLANYQELKRMTEAEILQRIAGLRARSGLVSALAAIDAAIERVEGERLSHASLPQADSETPGLAGLVGESYDRALEALCGAGFVIAAEQIERLHAELTALEALRRRPTPSWTREIRQIRAVANLFKHEAEWGANWANARSSTRDDLPPSLAAGRPDNLRDARDRLGNGTPSGLAAPIDAWLDAALPPS